MADDLRSWQKVCAFMQKHCAVVLGADQIYLLEGRLGAVAKAHQFASVQAYVDAAVAGEASKPAAKALIDAMTTHESSFFRDPIFWQGLEDTVQQRLALAQASELRIWSAACSHGQEPYSLAIWLQERHPKLAAATTIVATDVSEAAILRGQAGIYTSLEVNRGLTAMRLLKHFEKSTGGFKVKDELRSRIQWAVHSITDAPPSAAPFDIVLCRNVLIYFDAQDRKLVLARLLQATRPAGFVGLGTGEVYLQPHLVPGWHQRST